MDRISTTTVGLSLLGISFFILVAGGEDCSECYSFGGMAFKFLITSVILISGSFYFYYKWAKINNLLYKVERQPVMNINMISKDVPTAIEGKILTDEKPLISPYTKTNCVFYHYIKEEYIKSGDNSYWKIIVNNSEHIPFIVSDKTGKIIVNLRNIDSDLSKYKIEYFNKIEQFIDYNNSEVDAIRLVDRKEYRETKTGFLGIFNSSRMFRVSEYVLVPDEKIFVYGWVYSSKQGKYIAESEDCPLIVSRKTKEKYIEDFAVGDSFFYTNNLFLFLSIIFGYIGLSYFFNLNIIFLFIGIFLVSLKMIIQIYNRMYELSNRIENSRYQISIELKKRNDLIPVLNDLVKKYSRYERGLIQEISNVRGSLLKNSKSFDNLNKNVMMIIENYPKIASSELFTSFMRQLSSIENNIAYYRGFYSKTVLKYNTLIENTPFNFLAMLTGFKKKEYLVDMPKITE